MTDILDLGKRKVVPMASLEAGEVPSFFVLGFLRVLDISLGGSVAEIGFNLVEFGIVFWSCIAFEARELWDRVGIMLLCIVLSGQREDFGYCSSN